MTAKMAPSSARQIEFDKPNFQAEQRKIRKRGLRWLHRHGYLVSVAVHTRDVLDHASG